jgi:hypothetical protein
MSTRIPSGEARPVAGKDQLSKRAAHDDELLAIVRANRQARESRVPPVGWWCIVLATIDKGSPRVLWSAGEVVAYYPTSGDDGEIWIRTVFGDVERIRLHGPDDEAVEAYEDGPAEFFESWTEFEIALAAQYRRERARSRRK